MPAVVVDGMRMEIHISGMGCSFRRPNSEFQVAQIFNGGCF